MTAGRARTRSLTSTAYDAVLDMILGGRLAGGTIVEERRLTDDLKLSRTPLREALGRLEGEGFLHRQGRKLVVKPVTERDFVEILHLRRIVEGEAAALAAQRISDADLAKLRRALDSLKSPDSQSREEHWQVDDLLHRTVAAASGNALLCQLVADLRRRTKPFSLRLVAERFYPSLNEHSAIVAALEKRSPEQARHAMVTHLDNARTNIIRKLGEI